jgi:DNA-binding NtrC family response regulator
VATVLIVEDEEIVRAMLSAQFSDRGHAVHTAESGERAIEIGRQLRPGVMVADFALPGLGGPATFAALRAEQPELHGYGMSGVYAPDEGARLAHSVGMIAFFSKPFQPAELIALVEANLRSQQPRRALAPKRFTNQPTNQPTLRTAGAAAGLPTGMVGTCAAIEEVRRLIRRVAPLPARVLGDGRDRYRQGTRRSRDPRCFASSPWAVRRSELRRVASGTRGGRTVRRHGRRGQF